MRFSKIKKVFAILLILVMIFSVAACKKNDGETPSAGGEAEKTDWAAYYKGSTCHMICSYKAGGGSDVGIRFLTKQLEKVLDCTIVVDNIEGGNGWIGWETLLSSEKDGKTWALINCPTIYGGYLDPSNNRKYTIHDFQPLMNHVSDYAIVCINSKEKRFTNLTELIEYAKKNEVITTTTGVGSQQHKLICQMNEQIGTKFVILHASGAADARSMIMSGTVDVCLISVSEGVTAHKDGSFKVIGTVAPERLPMLKDVPTFIESGLPNLPTSSDRGYVTTLGLPQDQIDFLIEAFKKAANTPEHKADMDTMNLNLYLVSGDDYANKLYADEQWMKDNKALFGWQ